MNIKKLISKVKIKLKKGGIKAAELEAEILLSYILKKPRSYLYIWPEKKISKKQEIKYKQLTKRRLEGEPIAYLIKHKEFYGFDFYVDKNVLIPRPETECLVEEIINQVKNSPKRKRTTIADIGTGSGCIAIALKKYLPKVRILASDISEKALRVAKKNAKENKVKINFRKGNLLEPWKNFKMDIIAANLPYLKLKQMRNKSIQKEPKNALYGGRMGLDYYRKLISQVKQYKKMKTQLYLEIDPGQTTTIQELIKSEFQNRKKWLIKKDLSGQSRIIVIK